MENRSKFALWPIFVIVFLACAAQAAVPVSPPESRFVWEPGEKLTFTWTSEQILTGSITMRQSKPGNEFLTIKLDNIHDRSIPKGGLVYSTTVETAAARYRPFGEHEVIWIKGNKYLAGNPEGKSNITDKRLINLNQLQSIMIDDDTGYTLAKGGNLSLSGAYVLEIRDVDAADLQVTLSLSWEGTEVDKKTIDAGKNYIYKLNTGSAITVHIDSVFEEKGTAHVNIKGIFQISNYWAVNEGDLFGVMKITKVSNRSITMRNTYIVDLNRGNIIGIFGNILLKAADSNTLRLHLYSDRYEKHVHRGIAGSYNLTAWDGLNYAGFLYDADSGNYSESLVITNMTGRKIPEGGLTYTSYIRRVTYAVTKATGQKISGTDGSYVSFWLGGKKYTSKNNGFAELLIAQGELMAHGDSSVERKTLSIGYIEFGEETWELGEGYTLTATSVDYSKEPRKARLVLKRNGVELEDVWLKEKEVYRYPTGENELPKLITYIYACFAGATIDMIQLRYTWFISDNLTQIKEGDRFGVFNVTVMEPDRIELKNREPIELKAGSIINLLGNLNLFVENSDELRFYPTNNGGTQMMPGEGTVNEAPDIPDVIIPAGTSPVAGRTERAIGFEVIIFLAAFVAVYQIIGRKNE